MVTMNYKLLLALALLVIIAMYVSSLFGGTTIVIQVSEPATSFRPGQVFELAGHVYYEGGTPVREAVVFIDFRGEIYRIGADDSGAFNFTIKMPSTGGVYNVKLAAEDLQKKRAEKVVEVTVS